jgi:hypothetical protein
MSVLWMEGYYEGFKISAALYNAVELTRARTDRLSPIDNISIYS